MMALVSQLIPLKWLLSIAAAIGAALVAWLSGRRGARQEAKLAAQADTIKAHEVRNEVDNRIASERDAKRRMHDDWSR